MSSSSWSDEEPPPAIPSAAGGGTSDRVRLVAHHNKEAPLEQHRQQVMLEVMDMSPSAAERSGLDLVTVLDVSTSMGDTKLNKMKTAMKFVIGKLGAMDRLSIVSFSDTAKKLCGLRCVTRANQVKLIKDVVDLKADGNTNMEDGLRTGLKVLASRRHSAGRVGSIIFMSDGDQNRGSRAENVPIDENVAVYTFGFGAGEFAKVLGTIASNSRGGVFYFVKDDESLSEHFSQILAGLLSVVVRDLKVTVWRQRGYSEVRKEHVHAGGYDKTEDPIDGSVTVSFGELYMGEARKVIVNLLLFAVDREYLPTPVLFARCWYSVRGKDMYSPGDHLRCEMRRSRAARPDAVLPEVRVELVRLDYTGTLRKASELKDLDRAKSKLEDAKKKLDDAERQPQLQLSNNPVIKHLRMELTLLLSQTTWVVFVSFLMSFLTSHELQRFTRGTSLYRTRRMDMYRGQVIKFEQNPDAVVRSADDDVKEEEKEAAEKMVRERRPRPLPVMMTTDHDRRRWPPQRIREEPRDKRREWAWRVVILLCTMLAIALILAGAAVFAVFLLYKPRMPYLVVSDARLGQLDYDQDGAITYLQASITIIAENNNSKADASFSNVDLALGFHGADVALLRAAPFVVKRRSSLPLRYNVVSAGQTLDSAGMQAMDEALKAGVVPLDLFGKARTRWKVGVFVHLKFWTRVSCRLRFFFPGNGTVMTADRQRCRSRSP